MWSDKNIVGQTFKQIFDQKQEGCKEEVQRYVIKAMQVNKKLIRKVAKRKKSLHLWNNGKERPNAHKTKKKLKWCRTYYKS